MSVDFSIIHNCSTLEAMIDIGITFTNTPKRYVNMAVTEDCNSSHACDPWHGLQIAVAVIEENGTCLGSPVLYMENYYLYNIYIPHIHLVYHRNRTKNGDVS